MKIEGKRSSRFERSSKSKMETAAERVRQAQSASRMSNQLSLSFYDQHTLRSSKKVILDNYLEDGFAEFCCQSVNLTPTKHHPRQTYPALTQKLKPDEIDFVTTMASKRLPNEEEGPRTKRKVSMGKQTRPKTREKGSSLAKMRKQLIADSLSLRLRMPPSLIERRQGSFARHK